MEDAICYLKTFNIEKAYSYDLFIQETWSSGNELAQEEEKIRERTWRNLVSKLAIACCRRYIF